MDEKQNQEYLEDIREIRSMMERSSRFISLSGLSGISAGVVALEKGEQVTQEFLGRLKTARDFLVEKLAALPGVRVAAPPGAMYVFLGVDGVNDSVDFAKRLVREQKLGLAPGVAFGVEGEGYLRWCFASSVERLQQGVSRFEQGLAAIRK